MQRLQGVPPRPPSVSVQNASSTCGRLCMSSDGHACTGSQVLGAGQASQSSCDLCDFLLISVRVSILMTRFCSRGAITAAV